jgi:hypothetical protein
MRRLPLRLLAALAATALVVTAGLVGSAYFAPRAEGSLPLLSSGTVGSSTDSTGSAATPMPTTSTSVTPTTPASTDPSSAPTVNPPDNAAAANAALASALAYAQNRGERAAIAVYDRLSGQTFGAGDTTAQFQSASVVKTFIVAQLFWSGQMSDPDIEARAYQMITQSDDDDADALYGLVGYDDLSSIVSAKLGLTGLAPPTLSGSWGSTFITASAMISFYQAVFADPSIGPWLSDAMAHTTQTAADGTDQYFGIPSATTGWAVKQGWVCCENSVAGVNSTGLVDSGRFIVVILTQGSPSQYLDYLTDTITTMAQAVLPNGKFPA